MTPLHPSAEQLSSFADGECSPDETRATNEHLFSCGDCRSLFESFRALDGEIRRAPRGAPLASLQPSTDRVIVAAAQQVVLNEATNTLYVLDQVNATVEARDAVTSELKAKIEVGGKPTGLALNTNTNTVFVLDSSLK